MLLIFNGIKDSNMKTQCLSISLHLQHNALQNMPNVSVSTRLFLVDMEHSNGQLIVTENEKLKTPPCLLALKLSPPPNPQVKPKKQTEAQ